MFKGYVNTHYERKQKAEEGHPGAPQNEKNSLNNLWGKFGQGSYYTHKVLTDTEMWDIVRKEEEGQIKFKQVSGGSGVYGERPIYVGDNALYYVCYKEVRPSGELVVPNGNIAIASYTTAHARIKLLQAMERIEGIVDQHGLLTSPDAYNRQAKRVLYHDTDSIVHHKHFRECLADEDCKCPQLDYGVGLGQFKAETKTPIVEYAAIAPKNWAYVTRDGERGTMAKGLPLRSNLEPAAASVEQGGKRTTMVYEAANALINPKIIKHAEELDVTPHEMAEITQHSVPRLETYRQMLKGWFKECGCIDPEPRDLRYLYAQRDSFKRGLYRDGTYHMCTTTASKWLRFNYTKRNVVSLTSTLPIGHENVSEIKCDHRV